jgi:hypothetical protein
MIDPRSHVYSPAVMVVLFGVQRFHWMSRGKYRDVAGTQYAGGIWRSKTH